jgi:uncharacterized protein (DUF302 family)
MKKWIAIGLVALALTGCENKKGTFLETVESQNDVATAVKKLKRIIEKKGLTYFATIDHTENAKRVGMSLKPETVVLFGDPKVGTKLMECNPSMGLDLPLRILFTTDYEGKTTITYTNPEYWTLKHNIKDKKCLGIIKNINIAMQTIVSDIARK